MNVARKLAPRGELIPYLVPRHGFYDKGLPADLPFGRRLHSLFLEIALRLRLFVKGAIRGLQGTGILGVGRLYASVIRCTGEIEHLGLLSTKLITDAAVAYIVDDWDGGAQVIDNFNYHGAGTGGTGSDENANQTALTTECTTALNPDSTRATGTKSQPAANQMRSVGTLTFDTAAVVKEHGLFTQAATGGGTLFDRSAFADINVGNGDSIQFTYTCTLSAGG